MSQTFLSPNQRPRKMPISILVIHYTEIDWPTTYYHFLNPASEVSAHLVIDLDGTVYRFVNDDSVAYHAGKSSWYGVDGINEYSIGIELVHKGISKTSGIKVQGDSQLWAPYDARQINRLMEICHYYINTYKILPRNIVGHSDIAAWRYNSAGSVYAAKQDPGPLFPWEKLAANGIGRWYGKGHSVPLVDPILRQLGYNTTDDPKTIRLATRAFQMHYRPRNISGVMDDETKNIALNLY